MFQDLSALKATGRLRQGVLNILDAKRGPEGGGAGKRSNSLAPHLARRKQAGGVRRGLNTVDFGRFKNRDRRRSAA